MKNLLSVAAAMLWCIAVSAQISNLSAEYIAYHTDTVGDYDLTGYTTIRVYAQMENMNDRVAKLSVDDPFGTGVEDDEYLSVVSDCDIFDHPEGHWLTSFINIGGFEFYDALTFDSWYTIGDILEGMICPINLSIATPNYSYSDVPMNEFQLEDGRVWPFGYCGYGLPDLTGKVLVGQFTFCGNLTFHGCFDVALDDDWDNMLNQCFELDIIPGCTDPLATNYNPDATLSNGTCAWPVAGCIDETACNFNPDADTDDGSCLMPGCTVEDACNYNPNAPCADDSLCTFNPDSELTGAVETDNNSTETYAVPQNAGTFYTWEVYGGSFASTPTGNSVDIYWEFPGTGLVRVYEDHPGWCPIQILELPVVVNNTVGLEENTTEELLLFPNPSNGLINLQGDETGQVTVYDLRGQVVFNGLKLQHLHAFNLRDLGAGTYILQIQTEHALVSKTLIIQ